MPSHCHFSFFFFNDTATTEIYTLSLHDALPISRQILKREAVSFRARVLADTGGWKHGTGRVPAEAETAILAIGEQRSEEHTSELQSPCNLVCRLLLEKKKKNPKKDVE